VGTDATDQPTHGSGRVLEGSSLEQSSHDRIDVIQHGDVEHAFGLGLWRHVRKQLHLWNQHEHQLWQHGHYRWVSALNDGRYHKRQLPIIVGCFLIRLVDAANVTITCPATTTALSYHFRWHDAISAIAHRVLSSTLQHLHGLRWFHLGRW